MNEHFDNVVLGGGEARKYIAWELARAGQRTARSDRILGFTMLGADAGEVVAVVQTARLVGSDRSRHAKASKLARRSGSGCRGELE